MIKSTQLVAWTAPITLNQSSDTVVWGHTAVDLGTQIAGAVFALNNNRCILTVIVGGVTVIDSVNLTDFRNTYRPDEYYHGVLPLLELRSRVWSYAPTPANTLDGGESMQILMRADGGGNRRVTSGYSLYGAR